MFNLTPVVKNLLIINVIVYFAGKILGNFPLASYFALWSVGTDNFRPYQLFTYMFTHEDFFHMLFNMLGLVFTGPILETFWGQKRFLLFYIITGIGAGVFSILIDLFIQPSPFSMIGASGAVYGLITAFGILFPNMEVRLLFLPFGIKAKYIILALGSMAIIYVIMPRANDNVAHLAHLGGIAMAIILIQFWRKRDTYR